MHSMPVFRRKGGYCSLGSWPSQMEDRAPRRGNGCSPGHQIAEFLLRACHDLKAPIRAIRAHAELIGKSLDLPVPGSDPRLAFIIEGAGKLDQFVDGLSTRADNNCN